MAFCTREDWLVAGWAWSGEEMGQNLAFFTKYGSIGAIYIFF
jgi:hypothetical protein